MLFTLEALQADHGDALLLHYGAADSPGLAMIDGGPNGIYSRSVRPRLEELRAQRAPQGALLIDFLVCSHIDDDHINGVLDLTTELVEALDAPGPPPFELTNLWHNAFNDIVEDGEAEGTSRAIMLEALGPDAAAAGAQAEPLNALAALDGPELPFSHESALVLASVPQGRRLRDDANRLGLNINDGSRLLRAVYEADLGDGLAVAVVGPRDEELRRLEREWDRIIKKRRLAPPSEQAAEIAAYVDDSIANLSSIVLFAAFDDKTMLLTGDARGDNVLKGLEDADLIDDTLHVDVMKVPHHGSDRNVEADFFTRVTADHYVISANGKHGNPDTETLRLIADARGSALFTMHLTNHDGAGGLRERLDDFFQAARAGGARFEVRYLGEPGPLRIDLGEELGQ